MLSAAGPVLVGGLKIAGNCGSCSGARKKKAPHIESSSEIRTVPLDKIEVALSGEVDQMDGSSMRGTHDGEQGGDDVLTKTTSDQRNGLVPSDELKIVSDESCLDPLTQYVVFEHSVVTWI